MLTPYTLTAQAAATPEFGPSGSASFRIGYLLLQLCHRDGFRDPALVNQTAGLLLESTRLQPDEARAWTALAYLMMVFDERARAREYLARALALLPREPEALRLQKTLERLEQGLVETTSGQELTVVRRLDEQTRSRDAARQRQLQQRLAQVVSAKAAADSDANPPDGRGTADAVPLPQALTAATRLPADLQSPDPIWLPLLCRALDLPEARPGWDAAATAALRQFQRRHGLPVHGRLDLATVVALNARLDQAAALQAAAAGLPALLASLLPDWPGERVAWLSADLIARLQALPESEAMDFAPVPEPRRLCETLGVKGQASIVSQGQEVIWLQTFLQSRQHSLPASGHFDLQTYTALRAWQQERGLEASGVVDASVRDLINAAFEAERALALEAARLGQALRDCLSALGRGWTHAADDLLQLVQAWINYWAGQAPRPPLRWPAAELGNSGKLLRQGLDVLLLQEILIGFGLDCALSGTYDSGTQQALRLLLSRHKLPMSGQYDARTRQACQKIALP